MAPELDGETDRQLRSDVDHDTVSLATCITVPSSLISGGLQLNCLHAFSTAVVRNLQ
jgi:hypothetical protein